MRQMPCQSQRDGEIWDALQRVAITFSQLDGLLVGGGVTKPVRMRTVPNKEVINFIMGPGMDRPMILGLTWLENWNPSINWRKKIQ